MLSEIEVGADFVHVSPSTQTAASVRFAAHVSELPTSRAARKKQLPWIVRLLLKLFLWDIDSLKLKVTVGKVR